MPTPRMPEGPRQLGNAEHGKAHWPLDLELHPDRGEDKDAPRPATRAHRRRTAAPETAGQLGNAERGKAHWPLDLALHPDREEEEVTRPLNPPPERRSTRRAQDDERPGS